MWILLILIAVPWGQCCYLSITLVLSVRTQMAILAHFPCILDYVYLANVMNSFFSVDIYVLFKYVYKHNMVCTHFFYQLVN